MPYPGTALMAVVLEWEALMTDDLRARAEQTAQILRDTGYYGCADVVRDLVETLTTMEQQYRLVAEDYNRATEQRAELEVEIARLREERDMLKPSDIDDCSFGVLATRLARQGHSYDAEAGIWWKDGSKPGIVRQLEADLVAARQSLMAVKTYVQHKKDCPQAEYTDAFTGPALPCTCGLAALTIPEARS